MLKVTELFNEAILLPMFVFVCLWSVLDFIQLSATGVAEIPKSTTLKGCPHTFVNIMCHDSPVKTQKVRLQWISSTELSPAEGERDGVGPVL
jgi:hypothetical protein